MSRITSGLMSSDSEVWSTPQKLFDILNEEFNFNLDPCANESNHKCERFYTEEQDGLSFVWGGKIGCL